MSIRDMIALARSPHGLMAKSGLTTEERGSTGGSSFGGERLFGSETDVNALWRPPARYETVRKMRGHPTTNAAIDAIVLSLLSRDLEIVPGGKDPFDLEIAEFVSNDLHNMSHASLFDTRLEAISEALWYGCAPYQTVYARGADDGKWHLRKLGYRPAPSVVRWPTDDHGGPDGIVQVDDAGEDVVFKMSELLVFVHRRTGGDLTGVPLSRRMYAPWYVLDQLYRIAPAAVERHGMGIPTMRGLSDTADEKERIEQILMGVRANALSYVRLASGQEMSDFEIKGLTGGVIDPIPLMEYMRREVFLSTFTQGQVLGSDGVGSLSLGETHLDMLMVILRAISRMETDSINRYLLPRWVNHNWQGIAESRMPRAAAREPDVKDVESFFRSLLSGTQAGVAWDRDRVRERAHEELGIPLPDVAETEQDSGDDPGEAETKAGRGRMGDHERTPAEEKARNRGRQDKQRARARDQDHLGEECEVCGSKSELQIHHVEGTSGDPEKLQTVCAKCHREWSGYTQGGGGNKWITEARLEAYRRQAGAAAAGAAPLKSEIALEALDIAPNFARMAGAYEDAEQRILKAAKEVQDRQIKNLINRGREVVEADDPDMIAKTEVRFSDELEAGIAAVLLSLYLAGQAEMEDELKQQGVTAPSVPSEVKGGDEALIAATAAVTALLLSDRVRRAWSAEALRQIRVGSFDKTAMQSTLGSLSDKAIADHARRDTTIALGLGRAAVGQAAADLIDHYVNSEVMDRNTCKECRLVDGDEVIPADISLYAPYAMCEGGSQCRGILVPVIKRSAS